MKYRDRSGHEVTGNEKQDRLLRLLYGTLAGRLLLKPLVQPAFSHMVGHLLNTKGSAMAAKAVVRKRRIALSDYKETDFPSYNAFFHRELLPQKRPIAPGTEVLISPCDGKLLCYPVEQDSCFVIKHSRYSLQSLLQNQPMAQRFEGGTLLVYKENTREYSLLETSEFGTVLMMEVGALLVGKIHNHHEAANVCRGMEKGYFEFGGSSVLLCFEKGRIAMDADILHNSREQVETLVRLGERIGAAASMPA